MDVPKKAPHTEPQTLKQLYRAKRAELYAPCPQVARFEQRKRRWFLFLIALCLAVSLADALYMSWTMSQTAKVLMAAGVIISIAPDLIFLLVAMGTRWQAALTLYLIPPLHLLLFLYLLPPDTTPSTLLWFVTSIIIEYPLLAVLDVCQLIYLLLTLVTAIILTVPPRNRTLCICSHNLNQKMLEIGRAHV